MEKITLTKEEYLELKSIIEELKNAIQEQEKEIAYYKKKAYDLELENEKLKNELQKYSDYIPSPNKIASDFNNLQYSSPNNVRIFRNFDITDLTKINI